MKKYFSNYSLLFRNRNFGLLYLGQFTSFFGTMITSVAVPYQVYHITHSILSVGMLSLFQLLPLLFTALLGGVFADRYSCRRLLFFTELFLALGCLILTVNSYSISNIWVLSVVSIVMSAITGLHRPALESMAQQLVAPEDYPQLSSLASLKVSIGMLAGPAVGGVLIATLGVDFTYFMDFVTFAISLVTLLLMTNLPKRVKKLEESTWLALKSGFKYAFSKQELMGTYVVDFAAMIFGMPMALFPAMAHAHGGAQMLGLLYATPAVGTLIVSLTSGWIKHIQRHGLAVAMAAAFWGVAIIFFGLIHNIWWSLFFLMLAGAFDTISGIFRGIMWNQIIPNHYRGRLAGIEMISYLSGPKLGDAEAGFVAATFGITASIVSGGVLCLLGIGIACYFLPKFIGYIPDDAKENALDNGDLAT